MDDDGLCVLCDYLVAVVNVYMSEGYTEVSEYTVCTIYYIGNHIIDIENSSDYSRRHIFYFSSMQQPIHVM